MVLSRMKKRDNFSRKRIGRRDARSFVTVATAARPREIVRFIGAAKGARHDVVNIERAGRTVGGALTILAQPVGTLLNFKTKSHY